MELKKGYKQTEAGILPADWNSALIPEIITKNDGIKIGPFGSQLKKELLTDSGYKVYGQENVYEKDMTIGSRYVNHEHFEKLKSCAIKKGDFLISMMGTIGKTMIVPNLYEPGIMDSHLLRIRLNEKVIFPQLLQHYFSSRIILNQVSNLSVGGIMDGLSSKIIKNIFLPLPPTTDEQTAIVTALDDMDTLIASFEKLIEKKKAIKQGAMQQLLKPKKGWMVKKLGELINILDNLRVPLNDNQRAKMKGEIPYCGANGIVDYVNDYVIDDDIILMAEDGGYFDEYKTRPIAYRMKGKCWVNNHAHILQANNENDQGFLYFSLVHKNILDFINGGTRAKLNKGDLINIEIATPLNKSEQNSIALILDDIDFEILENEHNLFKFKMIKQGMMQELLTGKTRLK